MRRCPMSKHLESHLSAREFKAAILTFMLAGIFMLAFGTHGNAAEPSASSLTFQVATVDKITDFQVHWVAAGGGVLTYGAGQHVNFALVDDPFSPVSQLTFDGVISEALILGKYALLSQEGLGLRVIDLSVPSDPLDLGLYPLSGTVFHLASWGNLLFVSGVDPGIQIFEFAIFNGQNPTLDLKAREVIPVSDPIMAMAASEWKIYAATGKEIKVYDLTDPSLILEIDSLPITLPARAMAINGDSLFVAAGAEGLHIIDLSAPVAADLLATHPVRSESLYLAGRLVYVAAGNGGLHLLNAGPIATATFDVQVGPGGTLTFSPDPVNVNTGDTVNWIWGSNLHSTTSGIPPNFNGPGPNTWDSGLHNVPFSFQFTFNTPGSFPYFCSFHLFTGTVNVSGGAATINISVSPTSLDFGNVNVGSSSDLMITITNEATSTAALTGTVSIPTPLAPPTLSPFSIISGGGAFNLMPGTSVTVTVRFSPTAAGSASASLFITHNATNQPANPVNIALSGTGISLNVPVISIIPTSEDYGIVKLNKKKAASFIVTNSGKANLSIASTITGTDAAMFTTKSGSKTIKPGKSTTIKVTFKPTSTGSKSADLEITTNDPNNPTVDIPLTGTGQ